MDWATTIEHHRLALARVVAALLDLAGLSDDGTMARQLRCYMLRILRPAESALRRLLVIAARDLVVTIAERARVAAAKDKAAARKGKASAPVPDAASFPLVDPLKRFSLTPPRRRSSWFPRVTILGVTEPCPIPPAPAPGDRVDGRRLLRRLAALQRALDDLPRLARRMARWQARAALPVGGPRRVSPMRPGHAPGRRKRPIHEVDGILRECHALAIHALSPNSS